MDVVRISKRPSYVLRHRPDSVGPTLDPAELEHVVATNDKRRFAIHATRERIRASQGHTRPVVLRVDAAAMAADGIPFAGSDNGVWLVDAVPVAHTSVVGGGRPLPVLRRFLGRGETMAMTTMRTGRQQRVAVAGQVGVRF